MRTCERCGMIYEETAGPCPNCARMGVTAASTPGNAWPVLKVWLSSPLVLVLAILTTVSVLLPLLSQALVSGASYGRFYFSINILALLIAIGLWVCYGTGKSAEQRVSPSGLKMISGSLLAIEIILHIVAGLIVVFAVLMIVSPSSFYNLFYRLIYSGASFYYSAIPVEYLPYLNELLNGMSNASVAQAFNSAIIGIGVALIIGAGLIELINLCFFHRANRFARSLKVSAQTNVMQLSRYSHLKGWLIFFAVIQILGILSAVGLFSVVGRYSNVLGSYLGGSYVRSVNSAMIMSVLSALVSATIYIVTFVWIKKCPDQPLFVPNRTVSSGYGQAPYANPAPYGNGQYRSFQQPQQPYGQQPFSQFYGQGQAPAQQQRPTYPQQGQQRPMYPQQGQQPTGPIPVQRPVQPQAPQNPYAPYSSQQQPRQPYQGYGAPVQNNPVQRPVQNTPVTPTAAPSAQPKPPVTAEPSLDDVPKAAEPAAPAKPAEPAPAAPFWMPEENDTDSDSEE